ncbi:three-Cys-motif partner protein TcmP [Bradyrhizobium japonicum]|uniref:three-Cys-motif partner protein TcmP n=1 Tax=Bradyrhizobium japonicum TaxID=375 RepID=UPI000462DE0C|nr:three-Cys-motif partner protein TcmP [Bradyrhizobium japonicum]
MGELVRGDDGLDVEEVGPWARDKIASLCRYISISRAVRRKWLGPGKAGATYVELFCGPGRSKVRRKDQFIEGSCVAAWKESVRAGAPFSSVFVADADDNRRKLAVARLQHAGAPVIEVEGDAVTAARTIRALMSPSSLHFVFVDPYNLGAFKFEVMETFAGLSYIDMLVHISKMDIQRNTGMNIRAQRAAFDDFAPGWRSAVDMAQRHPTVRRQMFEFWRRKVSTLGISPSADMELITNEGGQHLYWLTLLAKHELALRFWKAAANKTGQQEMKL